MIKRENYINIQGWMTTELGLTGNELLAYAIIFGFSQDEESQYQGGVKYIAEWLGCSYPTALSVLKSLYKKGLVDKIEVSNEKGRFVNYMVIKNLDGGLLKNLTTPIKKFNNPPIKNFNTEIKDINNINNNIKEKKFYVLQGKFYIDDDEKYCEGYTDLVKQLPQEKRDSLCEWFFKNFEYKEIDLSFIRRVLQKAINDGERSFEEILE